MLPNTAATVGELAVKMPWATRVFEDLGIDYCCGGDRSLADACAAAGVDVNDVQNSLDVAEDAIITGGKERDMQNATLTELIAHILEKHHVFTKLELSRLDALMSKVCSVHGQRHPELLSQQRLLKVLEEDLLPHMMKEEQMLFPYIIALEKAITSGSPKPFAPFGTVRNPVRMMSLEHDRVGDLLREMRHVTQDYNAPADGCISYRTLFEALEGFERDLHQHIHLENNVLFPRAIEMEDTRN